MADPVSYGNPDRDIEQALVALKKGTQLIKYSRQGKPKFCPFRVSPDETTLIWYSHGSERNLKLSAVQRLIPGQRTPVFRRYLRPEKEYLSFSLIYNNGERSLDLICKDKTESEVWIAGLKALTSSGQNRSRRTRSDIPDLQDAGSEYGRPIGSNLDVASICQGRISIDLNSSCSDVAYESANMQVRTGGGDGFRISVSSIPSCSSGGSGPDDIESLGDVYVWGEVWSDGSSTDRYGNPIPIKNDVLTPKPLESNVVLDVHRIACGARHVVLVTRQGEVFSWGEEAGGRLGHGIEKDFSRPRLVEYLSITNIEFVACGEFHTCAVSTYGDLYTWGDGIHNAGLLGHGNDVSHWMPKRVNGPLEGLQVLSIACGTWHSALATSNGKLFTFGDGSFGVLGHGDRESVPYPKEVQLLSGLKTIKVACGVWHTAAIVESTSQSGVSISRKKLFTWGDGDKYRLGHGNKETYLLPTPVDALIEYNFHQIDCGHNITVGLTTSGHIFTMGSNSCGQLGNPQSDGVLPCLVQDLLVGMFVEEVACGGSHVAVLTSGNEVYTWGKGANGRLGHGDYEDRKIPTLVEALKDKHVKNIACGSNYTASICIHKWVSGADQSICTGCKQAFGFTRKRHNCYNCGLVHCHACSSKKALKAQLAPTPGKQHRVCDNCYVKLKKAAETGTSSSALSRKGTTASHRPIDGSTRLEKGETRTSRVLLSPTVEPVKYLEVKSGKPGTTQSDSYSIPIVTGTSQTQQHSHPPSQPNSRPASPYSRRPSPPRSVTPVFSRGVIDSLKKTNELLNQEVSKLQNQMKNLKQKSEFQEEEMQKLKKKFQEAGSLAAERSSKCIMAFNAMKGITEQLKEVTLKSPLEMEALKSINTEVQSLLDTLAPQEIEDNLSFPSDQEVPNNQNIQTNQTSSANESSERQDNVVEDSENFNADGAPKEYNLSSVSNTREMGERSSAEPEVIEQFEPGVYVTLIKRADGTNIVKRVRFSKRRFNSDQAEEWLLGNRERLYRSYAPSKISHSSSTESLAKPSTSTATATATVPEEENNCSNNNNETATPEENNSSSSNNNNETATPEETNEAAESS